MLSFIGLSAARSNKVINMQKYMAGVVVFGLFPIFYCIIHYMNDVIAYMHLDEDTELEDAEDILVWQVSLRCHPLFNQLHLEHFQNLPYGLLWYGFAFVAFQVHTFSLVFAWNLCSAWKSRGAKKTQ